jgi:hypothetical protein
MKHYFRPVTFLLVLMAGSLVASGQDNDADSGTPLFGKGTWLMTLHNPVSFSGFSERYPNYDYERSDFRLNLEHYYFFHNNMGVGLNLDMARSVSDYSYKQTSTSIMFTASYLQGFSIGDLNFLAKLGLGIGKSKNVNKTSVTSEVNANLARLRIEAGPVFKLFDNKSLLFQPTMGFLYDMGSYRDYKEKSPVFVIQANFIYNLGLNDIKSDGTTGFEDSHLRFARGINTISAFTAFDAGFGTLTDSYQSYSNKYIINRQSLMINYRHFVADRFSIGLWTDIRNNYQTSTGLSETTYDSKNTSILLGPGITWYPVAGQRCLENMYIDFNVGFGENTNRIFSNKVKAGIIGSLIDVGYDYGIAPNLSINPAFGFRLNRYDYPGTANDYTEFGPSFTLGLKASF